MMASLSFTLTEYILMGALLLVSLWQLYYFVRYMCGFWRLKRREREGKLTYLQSQPGVSVIVTARDEAQNLRAYLPHILEQDYPEFEVIVVDDGSIDNTLDVLNIYYQLYDNLRVTFVPQDAHVRSSKKLAITLGVKAAKYDYLLLTTADCCPESRQWIAKMMRNFTPGVEFVLGYNAFFDRRSVLNRLINYDNLTSSMRYMGAAYAGKPYMGVGANLAYRKSYFLQNRGFAEILNTRWGDDNLYVNLNATGRNTRVEASPESVMWAPAQSSWNNWVSLRERQICVWPLYTLRSKLWLLCEPLTRLLFYGLTVALAVLGVLSANWWLVSLAVLAYLLRLLMVMFVVGKAARRYGQRVFGIRVPLFDVLLPLVSSWLLVFRSRYALKRDFY